MDTTLREILSGKSDKLYTVQIDASVADAVNVMVEGGVGSVLIMKDEQLKGLFTERDLMCRVIHEGKDPGGTPVRDVMTTEIAAVGPNVRVDEAMSLCTQRRVRHLPVYDNDTLMGIVSSGDLTKAAVKDQQHTIEDLYKYIYGGEPT